MSSASSVLILPSSRGFKYAARALPPSSIRRAIFRDNASISTLPSLLRPVVGLSIGVRSVFRQQCLGRGHRASCISTHGFAVLAVTRGLPCCGHISPLTGFWYNPLSPHQFPDQRQILRCT